MIVRHPRRRRTTAALLAAATLGLSAGAVALAAPGALAATTAQVSDWPAQTITGIGASGAWWPIDLHTFSASAQQQAANLLFTASGIQLSTYRYNIGGGGVGVSNASRAPQSLMTSVGTYDWTRDPGGTTFLTDAAQDGVPTIVGFVNSAPNALTTTGNSCGGSLVSGDESQYATYLADVVAHFASLGITIADVSPFNEPDNSFSSCGQEGMSVGTAQRATIVRALGATLAARGLSTGITADESSNSSNLLSEVPSWLGASGVAQYVTAIAHHTYDWPGDSTMASVQSLGRRYGRQTWASEICCYTSLSGGYGAQYDPTIAGALPLANAVFRDFALTGDTQFHWWTALSSAMGCSPGSSSTCATTANSAGWNDGLIYYDPNFASDGNQTLYPTKRFYALGQYSRFVRPGSVRFPVTGAPSGVDVLATANNGAWTLVVTNTNTSASSFDVHFNALNTISASAAYRTSATENIASVALPTVASGTASLSLPAQSVSTYVFTQNGGTAVRSGAATFVGTQSGKCLDVTGGSTTDGTALDLNACSGASNQLLTYTDASELRVSGKCLDAYQQGTSNGTVVDLYTCNGGTNQKWTLTDSGEIRGVQSGLCVDAFGQGTANGTEIDLWSCNSGTNQQWYRPF
ncbi:MAG TPA: glycoside hydrolase [Rugosimonospora sp.]|nr:glycoside hydrolase [Rugosimonospora sp.]